MLQDVHECDPRGLSADWPWVNCAVLGAVFAVRRLAVLTVAIGALVTGTLAHAQSVTVTNVRLGQPGDRWLEDLQFRKIERETRNKQFGYAVTYNIAGHGTVRLFWPRVAIDFAGKRKRTPLQAMKLQKGRLWYPAVVTATSLPAVHRGILQVDAAYQRDARGAKRVLEAFANIASMGAMAPTPRLPPVAGGRAASGRMSIGSSSRSSSGGTTVGPSTSGTGMAAVSSATRAAGTVKASRRALARALERAGHLRPPESAAHHIVAGNAKRAQKARDVLHRFGIGINDARNGVFLPATLKSANPTGASVHSTLHTKAYYQKVNELLAKVSTRAELEKTLVQIGELLLRGSF